MPHTGQVDAFQDQRQVTQTHLDSSRRSRSVLLHSPRRLRHFKGPTFQVLVPNYKPVSRKPKYLYTIATPIEEEKQVTRFYLLVQFVLYQPHKTLETSSHICRAGLGKDAERRCRR
ncbi:MAG: hypothetical protein ABSA16_12135 [Thermoguttaceae bacterium]